MKLATFNVENLFISDENQARHTYEKPINKCQDLARAINEISADILLLNEVGGLGSLENFNRLYLNNRYHTSLIEGNSDRGIELAWLVKRGQSFRFEHYTHRNRELNFNYPHEEKENEKQIELGHAPRYPSHRLSRDIAELRIFRGENETPAMILLGVHLKSQLDKEGIDFGGRLRREAELKLLVDTWLILNKRYNENVPILLMGDFNGNAKKDDHDPEFDMLYNQTNLQDVLEILNIPHIKRQTLMTFDKEGGPLISQFDYIFVGSRLWQKIVPEESGIYHFKNAEGVPWPVPQTPSERFQMPSDHYPLVLTLSGF